MTEFRNSLKLLRFHFSVFLLPVSLFSFFYIHPAWDLKTILVLLIWHVLVFPSSNGYNSYHDQDEGPVGGLAAPPKATRLSLYLSNVLDLLAISLSLFVNVWFTGFVGLYILASRAYSNRKIRLKKFPIPGFLIVFLFQGAWIFSANITGLSSPELFSKPAVWLSAIASSFLIGTIYPITQIYQHEADRRDGVYTLSMLLGFRGTFVFSIIFFLIANALICTAFSLENQFRFFWVFNLVMFPSTLFFLFWTIRSFRSSVHINFRNTMIMLTLSSLLNNLFFCILLISQNPCHTLSI